MRMVAIGRFIARITWISASARAISARPLASSGRGTSAELMAGHDGSGCVNARSHSINLERDADDAGARHEHLFGTASYHRDRYATLSGF